MATRGTTSRGLIEFPWTREIYYNFLFHHNISNHQIAEALGISLGAWTGLITHNAKRGTFRMKPKTAKVIGSLAGKDENEAIPYMMQWKYKTCWLNIKDTAANYSVPEYFVHDLLKRNPKVQTKFDNGEAIIEAANYTVFHALNRRRNTAEARSKDTARFKKDLKNFESKGLQVSRKDTSFHWERPKPKPKPKPKPALKQVPCYAPLIPLTISKKDYPYIRNTKEEKRKQVLERMIGFVRVHNGQSISMSEFSYLTSISYDSVRRLVSKGKLTKCPHQLHHITIDDNILDMIKAYPYIHSDGFSPRSNKKSSGGALGAAMKAHLDKPENRSPPSKHLHGIVEVLEDRVKVAEGRLNEIEMAKPKGLSRWQRFCLWLGGVER